MSDQLDLGNYNAAHHAASELARQGLVVEELAYAARRWTAFALHRLAAAAVADTSAAVDSLAVAVDIDRVAVAVVVDMGRDCHAVAEADRMHRRAACSGVDSGHARPCVLERMPVSEQRLE